MDPTPFLETLGRGVPTRLSSVSGGCIADARCAEFADGSRVFVKTAAIAADMFPAEAAGLKALSAPGAIRVPEVLAVSEQALVLEWIETGKRSSGFSGRFGRSFAELHRCHSNLYGFGHDNYIGSMPQHNDTNENDWPEFFMESRLFFQARLAEQRGHGSELLKRLESAEAALRDRMAEAPEPPTLLHGDLWSGNYMVDHLGEPVLIDPAVYYGHREADLAMTLWFGGFDADFYTAYDEALPLVPAWRERCEIYRLYHVINHLNLFGSAYYGQAMSILAPYSAR